MTEHDLPQNSYAVLGLLAFGDKSGYDLKRFADDSIRHFFWAPAKSHIYSELRRLKAHGCVEQREVEQETRPNKRVYSITRAGHEALTNWLETGAPAAEVIKSPTALRVFFGAQMSPSALVQRLREYEDWMRARHQRLEEWLQSRESSSTGFFQALTIRWGLAYTAAATEWAAAATRDIEDWVASRSTGDGSGNDG